jgi:hypothetical protein
VFVDIFRPELKHLSNTHSIPGHQFENQPVPRFHGPKNDFIHCLFLQNIPMHRPFHPKHLFHHWNVAGILERFIDVVPDEIKKCG